MGKYNNFKLSGKLAKWVMFIELLMIFQIGLEKGSEAVRLNLNPWDSVIRLPTDSDKDDDVVDSKQGTRWAVLVAGSHGYGNYRHQVLHILLINVHKLVSF